MRKFKTAKEITESFISDGWGIDTKLVDYTAEEAKTEGLFGIYNDICNGKKFFKMLVTGNIFDDTGKVAYYNIPTIKTHNYN